MSIREISHRIKFSILILFNCTCYCKVQMIFIICSYIVYLICFLLSIQLLFYSDILYTRTSHVLMSSDLHLFMMQIQVLRRFIKITCTRRQFFVRLSWFCGTTLFLYLVLIVVEVSCVLSRHLTWTLEVS